VNVSRIALIIPHTDITLETDLNRELPNCHVVHTQRIWLGEVGVIAEKKMVEEDLPNSIKYLKGITEFDVAIFGCTSASALYGKEGLHNLEELISEELRCKGISAFGAVLKQLAKYKNKNVALVTPYTSEVNKSMETALLEFGYTTYYSCGMGYKEDRQIAGIEPAKIKEFLMSHYDGIISKDGTVLISCTNLRAMELRNELTEILDMPVITSNQSIIDWLMDNMK